MEFIIVPIIVGLLILLFIWFCYKSDKDDLNKINNQQANSTRKFQINKIYIPKNQYNSIKKQLSKLASDPNTLDNLINCYIRRSSGTPYAIEYEVVESTDPRCNFSYPYFNFEWEVLDLGDNIKFLFRDSNTRVSKKIFQLFEDYNIKVVHVNSKECFSIVDKYGIVIAYLDWMHRYENSKEIHKTFGWSFNRVRKTTRHKQLPPIVIGEGYHLISIQGNIYCDQILRYRNGLTCNMDIINQMINLNNKITTELVETSKTNIRFKGERDLFKLLKENYPDTLFQFRADWLKPQSIDFYIPSLNIGIEFQGQEHYMQIGQTVRSEKAYKNQIERDNRKALLCRLNGVKLIYWKYDSPITKENLEKLINSIS